MDGKRGLIYGNGRDFPLCIEIRLILGPTHHASLHVFMYFLLGATSFGLKRETASVLVLGLRFLIELREF